MTYTLEEHRGGEWHSKDQSPWSTRLIDEMLWDDARDTVPRRILKNGLPILYGRHPIVHEEAEPDWLPINTAQKNGKPIWAILRPDIYPAMRPTRDDLEALNGIQLPLRHPGIYEQDGETWDHGWNVAGPFGYGGIPDEWIAGWQPLPPPPAPDGEVEF